MAISKKTKEYVALEYAKYFGRTATEGIIDYYGSIGKTSKILNQIIKDANIEQYSVHGDNLEAEVHNEFQNLFSRNADNTELQKYVKVLQKGKNLPINSIVKKATKFDKDVYNNKQEIAKYVAEKGGAEIDLSKVTKTNKIDVGSLTSLADLQAKIDALPENNKVPSTFDGETYILTTGVDIGKAFIGTAKNDLFVATAGTLTVADSIDGGKGTDGLTIVETALIRNATFENSTMKSIEIVDITSSALDTDGVTAGNDSIILNTTTTGKVADNFKAVTDINLKATNATATSATIDATVSGTQNVTATANGTIKITGGKNIVAKTVGAITISDDNSVAGTAATIEKITIDGLAVASTIGATKSADALKELTVKNSTTGTLGVTTAVETLKVNFDNSNSAAALTLTDAKLKTLNVDASGKDFSVDFDTTSTILETINISGNAKLTLLANSTVATTSNVKEINVTNTKGVVIEDALNNTIKFTGGAGADTVEIGATTKAISMGAGDDTVKLSTGATVLGTGGSVDAGAGKDTIKMTAADAVTISGKVDGKFNSTFSNFEVLEISTATTASDIIDVEKINNVSQVTFAAAATATTTINNLVSGGTVKLTTNTNGLTVNVKNVSTSTSDVLILELSKNGILAAGTVKAAGVETININVADAVTTGSTAAVHTLTLDAADATSVVVSGNNGLNLTNTLSTKITTFDASGVVANGTADLDVNLAVTFTSANATVGQAVTIKGGEGDDALTGSANANDTIIGGKGADTITYNGGKDSFTGGEGADTFDVNAKGTTVDSLYLTIQDLTKGDKIDLDGIVTGTSAVSPLGTKVAVASGATFGQALDAASTDDGSVNGVLKWFQFESNTYLVVDNSAGATYVNAADSVIKITGLVDLSTSTVATDIITIA